MFETVVIATDGSTSAERAVHVALDVADRFDATVHALYVLDTDEVGGSPEPVREDFEAALVDAGERALATVETAAPSGVGIETAVREGVPAAEIVGYAESVDADLVATGTRGRHGEHSFRLGSVAEATVRRCPVPVLTVRQLVDGDDGDPAGAAGGRSVS
ncbi:MAG: universal stress protein [Halobacteriales archaeon]